MNRRNNPAALRALYIILVPIVLLIILLNSGILQRTVPAARIHGQSYTVVRYNYYYFDYYNTFLEENELMLDELGFDPGVAEGSQYTADGVTWKEFFQRQAEAVMAETAYYCDLAEADGYAFTEDELLPVREKLAENAERQAQSFINAKNFYISYYGSGMTEELYTAELTRQVKAQAYKDRLIQSSAPSQAEIDAYIAAHVSDDYRTVDLRVITLEALPDRETGEIGPEQLAALREKLSRLEARYENGESFEELQAAFSTCALGNRAGVLENAAAADLPDVVAAWCLADQDELSAGSTAAVTDGDGAAYFLVLDGFQGSGAEREASLVLGANELLARAEADIASDYIVERLYFGMLLATA